MERRLEVTMTVDITVPLIVVEDDGSIDEVIEAAATEAEDIIRDTVDLGDLIIGNINFATAYDLDGEFNL